MNYRSIILEISSLKYKYNILVLLNISYIIEIDVYIYYYSPFCSKSVARNHVSAGSHYVALNCLYTTVRPCTRAVQDEDWAARL